MRVVVQRVARAEVRALGEVVGSINRGFLLLVGFTHPDGEAELQWMCRKIAGLRVFEDENGLMNLALGDVGGEVLAVSQFTLYADVQKGRRPAFVRASPPQVAERLYERFCALLSESGLRVSRGRFGVKMAVELVNDGPVTIIVDTPPAL